MKEKINFNLHKAIISSDFFLISTQVLKLRSDLNNRQNFVLMDITKLISELKRLIRGLYSCSRALSSSGLQINAPNKNHYFLLRQYFQTDFVNLNININRGIGLDPGSKKIFLLLALVGSGLKNLRFSKDTPLIFTIDYFFKNNIYGYNVKNSINTNRKILFIIAILEKVLKKESNYDKKV